jgi:Fur family ferric uptake transcriptional regulator
MGNSLTFTRLRAQGFRLTPQRLAILEALQQARKHLSPAEIYQQVSQEMPGLTEATVYRTLIFLAEQGLVLVAHLGHGQLVYEYADHDHHHLICRECGGMKEIDHTSLKALYGQFLDRTGYQIDTIHAIFFGLCPECQVGHKARGYAQAEGENVDST